MPIIRPNYEHDERRPPVRWTPPHGRPDHEIGFEFVSSPRIGLGLRATRFFEKDDEVVGFHKPYRLTLQEKRRYEALRQQVYAHIEARLPIEDDGVKEWQRIASGFRLDGWISLHHWDMVVHDGRGYYTDIPQSPGPAWYYLNHFSDPNLSMTSVGPMARKVIKFKAKRTIKPGEILTFNYQGTEGSGWVDPNHLDWMTSFVRI